MESIRSSRGWNLHFLKFWGSFAPKTPKFGAGIGISHYKRFRTKSVIKFEPMDQSTSIFQGICKSTWYTQICKPEVEIEKTRWRRRPSWKYTFCNNSAKYWRILMKFETQIHGIMFNWKITKPEVPHKNPRWPPPPSCFYINGCRFVAICPIITKFYTEMHPILPHVAKYRNRK